MRWVTEMAKPIAEQWESGYALGKKAEVGEDLPHPQDNHVWYHAVRAALYPRGMTISLFMRVVPLAKLR